MKLLLTILTLSIGLQSFATHLVGGEIYYDYLGSNKYKITLLIYRDCGPTNSNNTQFDANAQVGIFNNGVASFHLNVAISEINNVPITISNPCLVVPPSACIEEAVYEKIVTLPPISGGYDIVYQRCCRNPSTQNLVNPNSQGATYHAHIPGTPAPQAVNSSPRFLNYPPAVLCVNNPFVFDHSATDPDGDSLTYELCTPWNGANNGNPAPVPDPPPFSPVAWAMGFNTSNQVPGTPGVSIDPVTGELSGTPTLQGIFTFGVCVKEYRNGVLLSESRRDYQFWVTSCDPVLIAGIPQQTDSCGGLTIQFNNQSVGASFYAWDFGDGTTSTAANPQHTFPNPGLYTITLIANPGWPCADTAEITYDLYPPLTVNIGQNDDQCLNTNSYDFNITGNYGATATFFWDFGTSSNPISSTDENPTGVVFSDTGDHIVYMYVTYKTCLAEDYDTIRVHPVPEIDFDYPPQIGCAPHTVQFTDQSLSWEPLSYYWFYSDGGSSTDANPVHTFDNAGTYDVGLIITADSICEITDTLLLPGIIQVNPSPQSEFLVSPDRATVFQPFFELTDLSSSDVVEVYYIDATGDTIFQNTSGQYVVNDTGYFGVTQWVYNGFGCPDSSKEYIYIEPVTTIYIPNAFTPNGDGDNDIWMPVVRDVYDYELFVFDRWGNVMFSTTRQRQGWDGYHNGKMSPTDVYLYKIRYRGMNKLRDEKVGHFTLLK